MHNSVTKQFYLERFLERISSDVGLYKVYKNAKWPGLTMSTPHTKEAGEYVNIDLELLAVNFYSFPSEANESGSSKAV